ncbi:MAG: glycosyltransferase family 2 protein [Flavobacteriaceae bacterium]
MMLIVFICLFIIGSYFLLIFGFILGLFRLNSKYQEHHDCVSFSVVIPFRNEADNLPNLLKSILELHYNTSLFEVILVNDDSTDTSVEIITAFKQLHTDITINVINNNRQSNSPKKDAISTAIENATYNWIICTDADCELPAHWLISYSNCINAKDPNMIVGPVSIKSNTSFLEQFQLIDFLSMQGATMGGFGIGQPFMANGANLGYKKDVFLQLNGFENNNSIASGDDVFLLENFMSYDRENVLFLKDQNALVTTLPTRTWAELVNQRKRWAAKATHFKNSFTKIVGVIVFFANVLSILALFMGFFNFYFIWMICLKLVIDTILIYNTAHIYQQHISNTAYIKTVLYYPLFTSFIAISSLMTTFEWKGRAFKK